MIPDLTPRTSICISSPRSKRDIQSGPLCGNIENHCVSKYDEKSHMYVVTSYDSRFQTREVPDLVNDQRPSDELA